MNIQKSTSATIAIDTQAEIDNFIDNVAVLIFGMGHKIFEPLIKSSTKSEDLSDKQIYYIKQKIIMRMKKCLELSNAMSF